VADERIERLRRESLSGDHSVRTSYLNARLRGGELSEASLRIAATVGDPSAQEILDGKVSHDYGRGWNIDGGNWMLDLARLDPMAGVRAGVAAARAALPVWLEYSPSGSPVTDAHEAIQAWLLNPSRKLALAAKRLGERANVRPKAEGGNDYDSRRIGEAAQATSLCCRIPMMFERIADATSKSAEYSKQSRVGLAKRWIEKVEVERKSVLSYLHSALGYALNAVQSTSISADTHRRAFEGDRDASYEFSTQWNLARCRLLGSVRGELLSWALGDGDPVAGHKVREFPPSDAASILWLFLPQPQRVALLEGGVHTIGGLVALSESEILAVKGIGPAGMHRIKEALEIQGLTLPAAPIGRNLGR
jgi:hypothetical protein